MGRRRNYNKAKRVAKKYPAVIAVVVALLVIAIILLAVLYVKKLGPFKPRGGDGGDGGGSVAAGTVVFTRLADKRGNVVFMRMRCDNILYFSVGTIFIYVIFYRFSTVALGTGVY